MNNTLKHPTVQGKDNKISCHVYDENEPVERDVKCTRGKERDTGFIESFLRRKEPEYKYKGWLRKENCCIEIEAKEARTSTDVT